MLQRGGKHLSTTTYTVSAPLGRDQRAPRELPTAHGRRFEVLAIVHSCVPPSIPSLGGAFVGCIPPFGGKRRRIDRAVSRRRRSKPPPRAPSERIHLRRRREARGVFEAAHDPSTHERDIFHFNCEGMDHLEGRERTCIHLRDEASGTVAGGLRGLATSSGISTAAASREYRR